MHLGEAAGPQMVSTVDLLGTAVENIEMKVDLSSFQVSGVIDHWAGHWVELGRAVGKD